MKKLLIALVAGLFSPLLFAATNDALEDIYFSKDSVTLTAHEKEAIKLAKEYKNSAPTAIKPWSGRDGSILFLFGAQRTSIVCAVLQICDVALQPGEKVRSINLGDTTRWRVEPAIEGSGANETQHLMIKPMDVGLETSLAVTTNRRTYHLDLRSHRTKYMPYVAFSYPETAMAKWEAIKQKETKERELKTIPSTGEYLGNLNFDYHVSGSAKWMPVRVYNDGRKTIIEMPRSITQADAPALLVLRKDETFFKDEATTIVNYRVQNKKYIVDSVFDKAILVAGVGSDQERVTITRGQ